VKDVQIVRESDPTNAIRERDIYKEGPQTRMSAREMVEFCIILFTKKKREAEVIRRVENRKLYRT